ncbi:MAG: DUF2124 domain-containing protein [Candidatus Bathyarchaeota archaeon]|nr:DUF2124 domain-containing protein [Candidatus Bathyarchaeota archaeon]
MSYPCDTGSFKRVSIFQGKGVVGLNRGFKKLLTEELNITSGCRVAFTGSPGTCLPFAELLAYAVRDLNLELYFIPNCLKEAAVKLRFVDGYGFQISEKVGIGKVKVIVVLGGLAMPGSSVSVEDLKKLILEITEKDTLVVGFSFMGILDKAGWVTRIGFNYLIDVTIESVDVQKIFC